MIVISDLHIKKIEPFYSSIKQFLNYIADTYPEDEVVQLGDLFDTSTMHSNVIYEIINILKRFKKIHILQGNHDISRRMGLITQPLNHYDNIIVYDKMAEVEIEGFTCLMLPWVYNAKELYEQIKWIGNYCFAHVTNMEDSFNGEYVDLSKVEACRIYGHTHTKRDLNENGYVMGVNIPTRNLEISNPFIRIEREEDIFEFIESPKYFEYQSLNYGEFPENKNNILNIKNAPSYPSVYETYKDYYIRKEGIEILRTENDVNIETTNFEAGNIVDKFNKYSKDKEISKEINNCAIRYLQEVV